MFLPVFDRRLNVTDSCKDGYVVFRIANRENTTAHPVTVKRSDGTVHVIEAGLAPGGVLIEKIKGSSAWIRVFGPFDKAQNGRKWHASFSAECEAPGATALVVQKQSTVPETGPYGDVLGSAALGLAALVFLVKKAPGWVGR